MATVVQVFFQWKKKPNITRVEILLGWCCCLINTIKIDGRQTMWTWLNYICQFKWYFWQIRQSYKNTASRTNFVDIIGTRSGYLEIDKACDGDSISVFWLAGRRWWKSWRPFCEIWSNSIKLITVSDMFSKGHVLITCWTRRFIRPLNLFVW